MILNKFKGPDKVKRPIVMAAFQRFPLVRMKKIWSLLESAFLEWQRDKAVRLGASLSFYTVFSLPSLLMIAVLLSRIFCTEETALGKIVYAFQGLLGAKAGEMIQTFILQSSPFRAGVFTTFAGIVALLAGATAVFVDLQDGLNTVWEVRLRPENSLIQVLRIRTLSLLVALATGFLLLLSLIATTLLAAFGDYINRFWSGPPILSYLLHIVDFFVSFGMITVLFAMLFKVLPDAKIGWKDVWLGAAFTATLFSIGKFLIGMYLGRSRIDSIYGAAGSLAILFVWIYYHAQLFFFGAEFTRAYADTYGSKIEPEDYAMNVMEHERAQHGMNPSRKRMHDR